MSTAAPTRITPTDPAAWIVLTAETAVIALERSAESRAAGLADALREAGFAGALEAVARDGVLAAPDFALLDWSEGPLRAVLRGDARMTVRTADGEVTASGAGVTTWVERVLDDAESVALEVPGVGVEVAVGPASVVAGAAPASVGADAGHGDRADIGLADAVPVAAPEPAPETDADAASGDDGTDEAAADTGDDGTDEANETTLVVTELTGHAPTASAGSASSEDGASTPDTGAPAPTASVDAAASDYDYLFGETVYRTVAGAAVRLPADDADRLDDESAADGSAPDAGDHDGETVIASEIAGLADRVRADADASTALAAPVFVLVADGGEAHPLDRGVVVGRAPSVSQVSGGSIPRLVTIADDADISRNHLRVAIEGDAPVVTDLGSKNGTSIVQPGKPPQRLRANDPTIVMPGTVVDLGGEVRFTVREDG